MKTKIIPLLLATAAFPLVAATLSGAPTPPELSKTIRLEHYTEPAFPVQFRNKSISEGYAQVQLLVAPDGTLLDVFVSAYSHPEFAESAEHAVRSWVFRAVDSTESGALPQRFNVRINFRREGMIVVQGDFQEIVKAYLGQRDTDVSVGICKLRDLDNTPEAVNLVVPAYPEELKKQNVKGAAAISFFIDETGRVRVPSVAESSRSEFAAAAVAAVSQWTFVPPLRKGRPTRVFAVQEFNFTPESSTAKSAATK
jgi:TonB family protein